MVKRRDNILQHTTMHCILSFDTCNLCDAHDTCTSMVERQVSSCKGVTRLTKDHDSAGEAVQQEGHFALCEGPEEDAA